MEQVNENTLSEKSVLNSKISNKPIPLKPQTALRDARLIESIDKHSIEDVVDLKISRFLDRIGSFYPENMYQLIMSKVEKPLLVQILRRVGGNQVQAAKILGINRNTLRKKIKAYELEP
ncbi:MAG: helix-turn-helix domain-containing protein [Oligoflexales bacterium]